MPPSVIVPLVVMGEPVTVNPVVPPLKPTEVTVPEPPPPPPVVIVTAPFPSSVRVVFETVILFTPKISGTPSTSVISNPALPASEPVNVLAI